MSDQTEQEQRLKTASDGNKTILLVLTFLISIIVAMSILLFFTVRENTDAVTAQEKTVNRTECIRSLNNTLNDNRWNDLSLILDSMRDKDQVKLNKSIDNLQDLKGVIEEQIKKKCEPAISDTKGT